MQNFYDPTQKPKIKVKVSAISYDAHARRFKTQKEKERIKTAPKNVFEGWKEKPKSKKK